jgi:hypothetical protein
MSLNLLKHFRSMLRSADVTMGNGVLKFRLFGPRCLAEQPAVSCKSRPPRLQERQHKVRWCSWNRAGRHEVCLLACCAGVHVDFHANRHLNDLRCFPSHQRTPSPRHRCRINMLRPERKRRKPASSPLFKQDEIEATYRDAQCLFWGLNQKCRPVGSTSALPKSGHR